jgi:hypothetical protein
MTRRVGQLVLWLGLALGLMVTAYLLINTTFMLYDDEGYVLLTYQNFTAGGRLYDEIFSQYGPWPYVYHLLVGLGLNHPWTHDAGRILTAGHWVLCALLVGAITNKLTGRTAAAVFAALISFGLLWQMSSEPSHPGSLICVMLAFTCAIVTLAQASEKWGWLGAGVGVAAALLILTKINIGVLFIAGAGVAALRFTAWPARWQRPAEILATVGLLAVPWGLMGKRLDTPWVLILAVQFTVATAGLLWVTPPAVFGRWIPPRTWLVALGVFTVALFLVSATVCWRGTSLPALLQAVLVDPLRHPASFMIGFTWLPAVWPVAIACWLATGWAGWQLRQTGAVTLTVRNAVIALRLGAAVAFVLNAETWLTIHGVGHFIVFCLPLLPVFLVPLGRPERSAGISAACLWVAYLALPQVLHAYPVAGSQMGWGTFLLLPVMVAGMHDACQALAGSLPRIGRWLPWAAWSLLLAIGSVQLALLFHTGWTRYQTSKPFGLPGAGSIRAGDTARLILRVMTLNAEVHADLLFSRPGMYSYNIWSGVPTPTARNATHWFWLLDAYAQGAIIDRLRETPRTAIVTSEGLDDFLEQIHVSMKGPLQSFIQEHYRPLLHTGDFFFLVPKTSRAVPFAQFEVLVSSGAPGGKETPTLLQTNVALNGQPASVQLQNALAPWNILEDYTPPQAHIFLEPITAQGNPAGAAIELPHPQPVKGLFRVKVYTDHTPKLGHPRDLELVVRDANGAVLSESVY